jgi:hypothetical protein
LTPQFLTAAAAPALEDFLTRHPEEAKATTDRLGRVFESLDLRAPAADKRRRRRKRWSIRFRRSGRRFAIENAARHLDGEHNPIRPDRMVL